MTAERLISVAQRLDELAEEHDIPELATLSEEMGFVAEHWPSDHPLPGPNSGAQMPGYLRRIYEVVEREMLARGDGYRDRNADEYRAMYLAAMPAVMTADAFKSISGA